MRLVGRQSDPPRPDRKTRKQRPSVDDWVPPAYRAPEPERSDWTSFAGWLTLIVLMVILGVLAYFIFFDDPAPSGKPGLELRSRSDPEPSSYVAELAGRPAPDPADSLRPKSASGPLVSAATPEQAGTSDPAQGPGDPDLSSPPSPRRPSVSAAALAELLSQGEGAIESGDIAAARAYYEAAYEAGSAEAATALGRTYDPLFLREKSTLGLQPNPSKAMEWYRLGVNEGDPIARLRLNALRLWLAPAAEHETQSTRGDP